MQQTQSRDEMDWMNAPRQVVQEAMVNSCRNCTLDVPNGTVPAEYCDRCLDELHSLIENHQ